jgi:hypothetical protein
MDFTGYDFGEDDENSTDNACYGIGIIESTLTITNSTSQNNQIGCISFNATISIQNTTFSGKTTGMTAGVYTNGGTNCTMNNSVLCDFNTGNRSAALYTEEESENINVTLTNCSIYDNIIACVFLNGTNLIVNNCSIYDNTYGVVGNTSADLRFNYWGSVNGPNCSTNTYNEHHQGQFIEYNASITYVPWLDDLHETGSITAPIIVDDSTYYVELSAAIENATDGSVLNIATGIFNQSVDIHRNNLSGLYLNGTTVYGSIFNDTSITFNNVTNLEIRNITIRNKAESAITLIDFDNTLIETSKFEENGNGINCVAQGTANTIADTLIQLCEFDDNTNGIMLSTGTTNDSEIKELYVLNNTFHDNKNGINTCNTSAESSYINGSNLTITDNMFYDNEYGIRNYQEEVVNATYNYWFNHQWDRDKISAGPAGGGIGNGDKVSDNVSFSPFYAGHTTVIEDIAYNISVEDTTNDIDNYGFDWNDDGSYENWTTKQKPYILHTFASPANQTVRLQINGSGPYIGLFKTIVQDNVTRTLKTLTTGYNVIGVIEKEITAAELADKSSNITRISYWNETAQKWGLSYIVGFSETTDPENTVFEAGDEVLITSTGDEAKFYSYGYYPSQAGDEKNIANGLNWIVRTAQATNAKALGENLTSDGISWTSLMKWRPEVQEYKEPAFLPAHNESSSSYFTIAPGDALLVVTSATGTFTKGGW